MPTSVSAPVVTMKTSASDCGLFVAFATTANRVADATAHQATRVNMTAHAVMRLILVIFFLRGSISPAMRRSS